MASLEGLKWTTILVLFGRTSCVPFGTSTRRPLNIPFGHPKVWYGRSIDVNWTSAGLLSCSMKETSMLLLSWCSLCIAFWNYKVPWFLIAYFNLSLATHISDETFSSWKLLVLHSKSSNIASFTKQPIYIIFNAENVLSLACWFWFDTSCPNSMFKTYLFLNFMRSTKEASIFFFL